jgi:hypothetical protein
VETRKLVPEIPRYAQLFGVRASYAALLQDVKQSNVQTSSRLYAYATLLVPFEQAGVRTPRLIDIPTGRYVRSRP